MTDTTLPDPLVPAEVDLRDFQGMWVDTDRLLRSDTWMLGTSDEKASAFTLWAESWHQVPAASLPSNDRMLAKLSQAERWKASRTHALRGWVECSDGRLYHPVVAEKALEAWIKKLASAISGAIGNSKRWQVEVDTEPQRQQFRAAVDCLRSLNPASRTLKEKAVAVILAGSPPESPRESPPDSPPESEGDGQKASGGDRKGPDQTRPDLSLTTPTGVVAPKADEPPPVAAVAAPPAPRGTRLPKDWQLPKAWGTWALEQWPQWSEVKVRTEADKFRDHWCAKTGKGSTSLDWLATWRNWCRSDIAHRDDPRTPSAGPVVATFRERDAELKRAEVAQWGGGRVAAKAPAAEPRQTGFIDVEVRDAAA